MKNEKISVIIPAYNIEKEISRCLDSVLNQIYKNIEIIVVDDGSTDKTVEILNIYEQKHDNIIIIHQENQGVFSARLNGIQKATGKWIGFVDGDDEIEEDMYFILMKYVMDYHADISHCGYQMNFPDRTDFYYGTGKIVYQDNQTGLKDLLSGIFVEPTLGNKLYRKSLFDGLSKEEGLDSTIKINEDLLMNFYLFKKAKCAVYYDKCYYHYIIRKHSASTAKTNIHKLEDPQRVLKILCLETQDKLELNRIVEERYIRQLVGIATMSLSDDPNLIRPYRLKARKELREGLKRYMCIPQFSKKIKILVIWAAFFPASYRIVHSLYAHITGIDKKYEIK